MRTLTVTPNEVGQRMDKLLAKCLDQAGKGFLYRMIRKKNTTLNGKKCGGPEHPAEGDEIQPFLSDEAMSKFQGSALSGPLSRTPGRVLSDTKKSSSGNLDIVYKDSHILVVNKPSGMLPQKAKGGDMSLGEYILNYLIDSRGLLISQLRTFKPSICNRLDHNTSGLVVAGKSLTGLQIMNEVFKGGNIHKYYQCLVSGKVEGKRPITGLLRKNEETSAVSIYPLEVEDSVPIMTEYLPPTRNSRFTLLRVTLITGRSHQIRAHLSSMGYPIADDYKYGSRQVNDNIKKKYEVRSQLFHSWRLGLPRGLPAPPDYLGGRKFIAPLPGQSARILKGEGITITPTGKP